MQNYSIESICDLLIHEICIKRYESINYLKLCHLIYYADIDYMLANNKFLFKDKFEPWVFCPVNQKIHKKLAPADIYADISRDKISSDFNFYDYDLYIISHISAIVEKYHKGYSMDRLVEKMRRDYPFILAREGCNPIERCSKEINKAVCKVYYKGIDKLLIKCDMINEG